MRVLGARATDGSAWKLRYKSAKVLVATVGTVVPIGAAWTFVGVTFEGDAAAAKNDRSISATISFDRRMASDLTPVPSDLQT